MNLILKTVLVIFHAQTFMCIECPPKELIEPCICLNESLFCGGNGKFDLGGIFDNLDNKWNETDKHFNGSFYLNNTAITEIKDKTFRRITFNEIKIEKCYKLARIEKDAFFHTDLVTNVFDIRYNPQLEFSGSFFGLISKFIKLKKLVILDNDKFEKIPENAFKPVIDYQDQLKNIVISGKSLMKIENNAFSSLNDLANLVISGTILESFPENAMKFNQASNEQFKLTFIQNTRLNASGLAKVLTNINRPTLLSLENEPNFDYLKEEVFKKFLNSSRDNKISMKFQAINCKNCENKWIKNDPELFERIEGLKCKSGKKFNDTDNFSVCDPFNHLSPCKFIENEKSMYCTGTLEFDLKSIMANLSEQLEENQKQFNAFYLNNTSINELEENVLNDLTFENISIDHCHNLTKIDSRAFSATNMITKHITLRGNTKLSSSLNIYEILSSFPVIETISLWENGFTKIPSNAFKPLNGYQRRLRSLILSDKYTVIENNAFYNLDNLTWIDFVNASFQSIHDGAFAFKHASNEELTLEFHNSLVNNSVFTKKSLINIKRPTTLLFSYDINQNITYFSEEVFLPFFLENKKNIIKFIYNGFDCNDCRNYWLKKNNFISRLMFVKCSNGKVLANDGNFKNCS